MQQFSLKLECFTRVAILSLLCFLVRCDDLTALCSMDLTLFLLISGLVIGFSVTAPVLDSPKGDLVIPVYQTLTVTCRYVFFIYTVYSLQ